MHNMCKIGSKILATSDKRIVQHGRGAVYMHVVHVHCMLLRRLTHLTLALLMLE